MKRRRRRRPLDGVHPMPLTPAQVNQMRTRGTSRLLLVTRVYVMASAIGAVLAALTFQYGTNEGHHTLVISSFVAAGIFFIAFTTLHEGKELPGAIVSLMTSAVSIIIVCSQVSAGISVESYLFGLAILPFMVIAKESPPLKLALSSGMIGAYFVCELAFPEGSGQAEFPADLAFTMAQTNRVLAGLFVAVALLSVEMRHDSIRRILEGAARYGELRSTTDELTGVYNRRPVIAQLSEWAARGRGNYAIALIDLDHFKAINDKFGHDCGDTILQSVAGTLRDHFRDSDMVSRWGGDEFLVLMPGVRHADLLPVLERLRKAVSLIEKRCPEHLHTVTVSIGAAMGAMGQTPDECIAAADHALYRAKEAGRDTVVTVGTSEPTKALGRPMPDGYEPWSAESRPQR